MERIGEEVRGKGRERKGNKKGREGRGGEVADTAMIMTQPLPNSFH